MGQYWHPVNVTKREFIHPHKLGCGLKLGEQLGGCVGDALVILCAAMPERRGGGDFDLDSNFYGPERTEEHCASAPVVEDYNAIAKRTIGRWAGDRIALVGDYAQDDDLKVGKLKASQIYDMCHDSLGGEYDGPGKPFLDVSDDVCAVIEHERGGVFIGTGWRKFVSELFGLRQFGSLVVKPQSGDQRFFEVAKPFEKPLTHQQIEAFLGEAVRNYQLDHEFSVSWGCQPADFNREATEVMQKCYFWDVKIYGPALFYRTELLRQ